jgi:hypothetical protein
MLHGLASGRRAPGVLAILVLFPLISWSQKQSQNPPPAPPPRPPAQYPVQRQQNPQRQNAPANPAPQRPQPSPQQRPQPNPPPQNQPQPRPGPAYQPPRPQQPNPGSPQRPAQTQQGPVRPPQYPPQQNQNRGQQTPQRQQNGRPMRNPAGTMNGMVTQPKIGGGAIYSARDGKSWETGRDGQLVQYKAPGVEAHFGPRGVSYLRDERRGITIQRQAGLPRQVASVHGNMQVVSVGRSHGYVQRPFRTGYVQRTYVNGRDRSIAVFQEQRYRGNVYYHYVAPIRYRPGFYVWLGARWNRPIRYDWGFAQEGWYQGDAAYFTPAGWYGSPSAWLADYVIGSALRDSYAAQTSDAGAATAEESDGTADGTEGFNTTPVTGLVESTLASSITNQINSQAAEAQGTANGQDPRPDILANENREFVISSEVQAILGDGMACRLSGGAIVIRLSDQFASDGSLSISVASNPRGDCPGNATVSVDGGTLQEQLNQYRQRLEAGVRDLAAMEGTHSVPAGPDPGAMRSPNAPMPMNTNGDAELIQRLEEQADQSEADLAVSGKMPAQ